MCVYVFTWAEFCCSFVWIFCCYVTYYKETSFRVQIQKHLCSQILHWKDWCWSWNSNTLATWCKELTHLKRLWFWERLRAEEKGLAEDEMVGYHHWLNGFGWTLGVGDGPGGLACYGSWGHKELDTTERLNWTDALKYNKYRFNYSFK